MPHKLVDSITSLLCSTRFWLVCSSLPQSSPRAYGDDTDDKIRRLEARITQLEQRLAALEEKATTDRTVKQSSDSGSGIAHADSIAESIGVVTTDPRTDQRGLPAKMDPEDEANGLRA